VTLRIQVLEPSNESPRNASEDELPALLRDPANLVWIDMSSPGDAERKMLERDLSLHPLVIADMLADATTPKLERFDTYLYVVFHALADGAEKEGRVETVDYDFFVGSNWVVSSHPENSAAAEAAQAFFRKRPGELRRGGAFVMYKMVEHISDRFPVLMEKLDEEIDALEAQVLHANGPQLLEQVFAMKRKLQRLRRVCLHEREVLNRLGRGECDFIGDDVLPFFRDAHDHFVRVVDLGDSFREIVNGTLEAYISINGHKMNEVMKVLTLSSTIMLPLTFIAGLYGMNFEVMPELHWHYGYFVALGTMALTAALLVAFFKRKGWF
jgi:magnesium transporter